MTFVATDPQSHQGETNTWLTPLPFVKSLGEFDLDPCGFKGHPTANKLYYLPHTNGLLAPWFGRIWLNPPYGKFTHLWLKKLELHGGGGIALIFARTDTKWLQPFVKKHPIFLIEGRIKFVRPCGLASTNAGSASMLIPFGQNNISAILNSGIKGCLKI